MSQNDSAQPEESKGLLARWQAIPLYFRIVISMVLAILFGMAAGEYAMVLHPVSTVILQLLGALAPPLILIAVVHVLMTSNIPKGSAKKLIGLLLLNTCVAIFIGLTVANTIQPGRFNKTPAVATSTAPADSAPNETDTPETGEEAPTFAEGTEPTENAGAEVKTGNPLAQIMGNIPRSILGPLGDNQNVIGVIIIAVAFGIALRKVKSDPLNSIQELVEIAYRTVLIVLHWIIELVPIGVFCVVASVVGEKGFSAFYDLGAFVLCVLLALALQTVWYLARIGIFSWVSPIKLLADIRDALVMAFSTGSSTATMPVTYRCLREKVGVREDSASLGSLVGANFNNDGTALYEAMAALFIAQTLNINLDIWQQITLVITSILASIGAAGIPEAGIVTMTLVFTAIGLPTEQTIPLLLTVDWFLDRCRTAINVLGDVNVSCILDGKTPEAALESAASPATAEPAGDAP